MGRGPLAASPVSERRRPTLPAAQPSVADRMNALRRRLQMRWETERPEDAVPEPDPPLAAEGSTGCVAVTSSTVEVAQPLATTGEASHQAHHDHARADGRGAVESPDDENVDDARGSKRRRLIAALSAPAPLSSQVVVGPVTTSGVLGNVTRPVARSNGGKRMRMDCGGGIMSDDCVRSQCGKKSRCG